MAVFFQADPPFIAAFVFPGQKTAVGIRPGCTSALAFHTKQHTSDKGMESGFASFIFSVYNI